MRHVLITGGSSGIGEAAADRFVKSGERVSICGASQIKAEEAARRINERCSAGAAAAVGDIRNRKGAEAVFEDAKKANGPVDVLINCAGIYPSAPILNVTDEEWDGVMDINLRGTFLCSQLAVPDMLTTGRGWIVNITSIDGIIPGPNNAVYSASKAGVISLTRSFAAEFSAKGINVNAVAPGWVGTPNIYKNDRWKAAAEKIPLGRLASPSEIADLIYFLCSEEAKYITGEVVNINGGMFMN